jgi:hypothetical protein
MIKKMFVLLTALFLVACGSDNKTETAPTDQESTEGVSSGNSMQDAATEAPAAEVAPVEGQ